MKTSVRKPFWKIKVLVCVMVSLVQPDALCDGHMTLPKALWQACQRWWSGQSNMKHRFNLIEWYCDVSFGFEFLPRCVLNWFEWENCAGACSGMIVGGGRAAQTYSSCAGHHWYRAALGTKWPNLWRRGRCLRSKLFRKRGHASSTQRPLFPSSPGCTVDHENKKIDACKNLTLAQAQNPPRGLLGSFQATA